MEAQIWIIDWTKVNIFENKISNEKIVFLSIHDLQDIFNSDIIKIEDKNNFHAIIKINLINK